MGRPIRGREFLWGSWWAGSRSGSLESAGLVPQDVGSPFPTCLLPSPSEREKEESWEERGPDTREKPITLDPEGPASGPNSSLCGDVCMGSRDVILEERLCPSRSARACQAVVLCPHPPDPLSPCFWTRLLGNGSGRVLRVDCHSLLSSPPGFRVTLPVECILLARAGRPVAFTPGWQTGAGMTPAGLFLPFPPEPPRASKAI